MVTTLVVGGCAFAISKLTLGTLRQDDALQAAIASMGSLRRAMAEGDTLPSAAQLDAMVTIVFAAAHLNDPELTRARVAAAFDAEAYDDGLTLLSRGVAAAMYARAMIASTGDLSPGEAASPSSSISVDSTGSSPRPSATDSPTSTISP